MFEIGFPELILIAIIGLLVIGPERLPEALRTLGLWIGRMRRSFNNVKTEIEKEVGMDEIRRQLHNEAVMEEMKRIERDVRDSVNSGASNRRPAGTEPAATGEEQNSPASTPGTPGEQTGSDAEDSAESEAAPPRRPGPSEQPSSDRSEPDRSAPSSADDRHHG